MIVAHTIFITEISKTGNLPQNDMFWPLPWQRRKIRLGKIGFRIQRGRNRVTSHLTTNSANVPSKTLSRRLFGIWHHSGAD